MPAIPVGAEKMLSRKKYSEVSFRWFRKRFLKWWNLWSSALIGDLLLLSLRR